MRNEQRANRRQQHIFLLFFSRKWRIFIFVFGFSILAISWNFEFLSLSSNSSFIIDNLYKVDDASV